MTTTERERIAAESDALCRKLACAMCGHERHAVLGALARAIVEVCRTFHDPAEPAKHVAAAILDELIPTHQRN
jgi:hypothetical protein